MQKPAFFLSSLSLSLVLSGSLWAQLPAPPDEKPVIGARLPALSPDGKTLAFVYRGDIWVSPVGREAEGERATRLTDHAEYEGFPIFSPDGKWIAFSSMRNGNADIFVVPASGGTPRQLTFSGSAERAHDWSPDGKKLLFSGRRDKPTTATLYELDLATLKFTKVVEDYKNLNNAAFSPDGSKITYERLGFPWTRPRYHGSGAAQLWVADKTTGKRVTLADDEKQHLWPKFTMDGNGIVCVTVGEETPNASWLGKPLPKLVDSAMRTPNLWYFPVKGGSAKQLTHFVGGQVRAPQVARKSGDIVFEHEYDVYLLRAGAKSPQKVTLFCPSDDKTNDQQRLTFTNSDVQDARMSPDAKQFVFTLRGDLWTVPVDKTPNDRNADLAKRLTTHPGFDKEAIWSKDGKFVVFLSDRGGVEGLYAMEVATLKTTPLWTGAQDARSPRISPDGKMVGFWVAGPENVGGLYTVPLDASAAPKRIIPLRLGGQSTFGDTSEFSWSPDMQWIAYNARGAELRARNIFIAPADGANNTNGTPKNVTLLNADHDYPVWSPDGKYLFFRSDREGGGLYVLPLKPEEARTDEKEIVFEKPTITPKVEIDFEDMPQRIRKINGQDPNGDVKIAPDGQFYMLSAGDIYRVSFNGKETTRLTTVGGVGDMTLSEDGKKLSYTKGGQLFTLGIPGGGAPTNSAFVAQWQRSVRAERKAAFEQFWRAKNTQFYDGNFHGRDWKQIHDRYEPLLSAVGTSLEFGELLNRMMGEVEASHAEVSASASSVTSPSTAVLGFYLDYDYEGPGLRVKEVPKRAPASYPKTRIQPGEYVLQIDGQDVNRDENLYQLLNDKGNRDFAFLVNDKPSKEGARTVKYRALTSGEWSALHYQNRVEASRKQVESKSNGTVTYLHIEGMGGPNQALFEKEVYAYAEGKKGLIIDVRDNGGGNIADTLVSWLITKPYATFLYRDGYADPGPSRSWDKPIVVLMNENSFSNAEMFPYDMRATGLAKIVGMPTPGYVIWTFGPPALVDGTNYRMPRGGVYRKDGSPMENLGEKPDIKVPLTWEDYLSSRDPQLEKAIELLKK
jgi:tricorn protease